ncbi:MAG: hypothetical protein A2306_02540 [Omnitrophica WOR_2 bacterium RIFOXYB2_FULL_38_16]|nr:MAG: hypothetical protein A2447_10745 [Omnitrophica WOR_2 bacterium RIFOXYC2_FULL_38_12]OGX55197.1 MAG: hypothetical protein A2306_02540 [Omnitrophica WOR_2 bacterium RIFOXYB2_FULL_38_16]
MKIQKTFRMPDTGAIKNYDKEGKEIFPVPKDDLWGQNGCYVVNPMSFTKLGKQGKSTNDSSSWEDGYRTVLDNNTGLVWEIKSPKKSDVNYCENKYTWKKAKDAYIKDLNKKKYGGFSDWRLPNKDELRSIIDYSKTGPSVDIHYFPNCRSDFYWTSVPYNMQKPFIWGLFFGLGSGICYSPLSERYVRAVRGGYNRNFGKVDSSRFKDNNDGTITDTLSGLMWQKGENERMDWYSALKCCKNMRLADYSDWRLPNLKELNSILNLSYENNWWYYKEYFPAEGLTPPLLHYFSSTPYEGIYVWVTNFCFGYDGYYANKNAHLLFRAVRNVGVITSKERPHFKFPDSGQKKCYNDEGGIIKTPKKAAQYFGQDGTYSLNPLSFTKLSEGAKPLDEKADWKKGLRMVKDNNTGLVWETKSPDENDLNFKGSSYTWEGAHDFVEGLNKKCYGGFRDWRLPNREELRMLVDYNGQIPATDEIFFADCLPAFYWSKDLNVQDPILAWGVYFAYGCAISYLKSFYYPVRAVRGGYSPGFGDIQKYAFKDNNDGTVSDFNTGLMWKRDESPELNWEEALKYCQELNLGGHSGWRLPTIREMGSLMDLSFKEGVWFHKEFFPGTKTAPLGFYWASTTYGDTFGWGVNFQFGFDGYYAGKKQGRYPFRPVRSV